MLFTPFQRILTAGSSCDFNGLTISLIHDSSAGARRHPGHGLRRGASSSPSTAARRCSDSSSAHVHDSCATAASCSYHACSAARDSASTVLPSVAAGPPPDSRGDGKGKRPAEETLRRRKPTTGGAAPESFSPAS